MGSENKLREDSLSSMLMSLSVPGMRKGIERQ